MGLLLITRAGAGVRRRIYSSGSRQPVEPVRSGLIDTAEGMGGGLNAAHILTLKLLSNAGRGSMVTSCHITLNVYDRATDIVLHFIDRNK